VVIGGALLVAVGFFSRDASVGELVKTQLTPRWSSLVDRVRVEVRPSEAASSTASPLSPPLVETQSVVAPAAIAAPAVAIVRPPGPSSAPAAPNVVHVARSVPLPASVAGEHTAPLPSAESENNPYAEGDAASALPGTQPANPSPSPFVHAPAL
jgi:hypothetical protein